MDENHEGLRRQMAQFFDATSDAIAFLDRNYSFIFLNRRAQELLSPSGELIGTNLFERFPDAGSTDAPYRENYRKSMEDGVATEFEAFYPAPLNLWFHLHTYPSHDGIMLFFRDITEERRKSIAAELKSEESDNQRAEIESLYRTAPIGLALFDLDDYHYLRLNDRQAAFFGSKPEQIVGKTLTEMAPIEGLRELFDQVAGGTPVINFPLEGTLITDPDDYRYWVVSYFPVIGSNGEIQGITAASLEITQQKKAEMALIESEKLAAVGRLAASIAHEINNPLESITNLLFLARHGSDMEEIRSYLDSAENELRRVAAITSQTLRFHKQATSPQAITGKALITSVLSIYQGRIQNSRVAVTSRHNDRLPVRCFEGETRQVISNLVSNALDAMSATGGRLLMRSREAVKWQTGERGIVITVADTGSGIPPATVEKIFKPFYTTKGITGTGLGLWISKEIMDRHNGWVRVRSRNTGSKTGTVFSIFLPYDAVVRRPVEPLP